MGIFKLLGVLSPAHITFFNWTSGGKFVGRDQLGNKYYQGKTRQGYTHPRRWVIYKGEPEASNVPPEWHGWLHHQSDEVPTENAPSFRRPWQKPHQANMTGTTAAYRPAGHALRSGERAKATGDYEAWTPEQ